MTEHYNKSNQIVDFYFFSEKNWCLIMNSNKQIFFYCTNMTNHISCGSLSFKGANGYYNSFSNHIIWTIDVDKKSGLMKIMTTGKGQKGISIYVFKNIRYLLNRYKFDINKVIDELKRHIPANATKSFNYNTKYPTYYL